MSRIFISHSSADDHQALALLKWLEEQGWSPDSDVYLDIHPQGGMAAGERWLKALEEAASRCEVVVFLISEAWLSSQWCSDELRLAQTLNKKIFPLLIEPIDLNRLPRGLTAEWQAVRLHTEPLAETAKRIRTDHPITNEPGTSYFSVDGLRRLKQGLTKAGIGADTFELQPDPDGPYGWRMPYRGLEPLQFEDAAVFFGRDADIVRGLDRLRGLAAQRSPRMLVVLGASGSGKSSYLRAGLMPRLLRDDSAWIALPPISVADHGAIDGHEGLISALADVHQRFGERVSRADLREKVSEPGSFVQLLGDLRQKAARRVLIEDLAAAPLPLMSIDQAEELANSDAWPETGQLLELLRASMDAGELLLVATIRSDNYDTLQNNEILAGIQQEALSLPAIASGEIARIIRGPAEVLAAKVGPEAPQFAPEVVDELQREMADEPDSLPLLAFALQRLVRDHAAAPNIGLDALATTGGIARAIGDAANVSLRKAGVTTDLAGRSDLLRRLFVPRLVRIDLQTLVARRRVAKLESFTDPGLQPLLNALIENRLLVKKGSDAPTLEVAHEALLRRWPELAGLLYQDREALLKLDAVQRAAAAWARAEAAQKAEFLVHRGQRLAAARALRDRPDFAAEIDDQVIEYLEACETVEREAVAREVGQKRLKRTLLTALVALVVIAGLVTVMGLVTLRTGERELTLASSQFSGLQAEQAYEAGLYDRAMRVILADLDPSMELVAPISRWTLARSAYSANLQAILHGHKNAVKYAVFAPDGERVVTASLDGTARVWTANADGGWSAQELRGHELAVTYAAFAPNGGRIVTASVDGTARLWAQTASGFRSLTVLSGHEGPVTHAAFAPDGIRVVTASDDDTARVWTPAPDGNWSAQVLAKHEGAVRHAAFAHDGTRVVTASEDGTARVWTPTTEGGWSARVLGGHKDWVMHFAFSPDGTKVVTASKDSTARVWISNADGGWSSQLLDGHEGSVTRAMFAPDGERVVTASDDGTARVWTTNADGGWSAQVLTGHDGPVTHAVFAPEGMRVVTASDDGTARLWTSHTGGGWSAQVLAGHEDLVYHAAFAPDGSWVVTASADGTARVWTPTAQGGLSPQVLTGHKSNVTQAVFAPDGERLLTASVDGTARVWSPTAEGAWSAQALEGHKGPIYDASFEPNGKRVVTASSDATARVWTLTAEGVWAERELAGHYGAVTYAVFDPYGERMVTASVDGTARVWSPTAEGAWSVQVLPGHEGPVTHATFSPGGDRVVTSSYDGTARVWSSAADSGWSAQVLEGHEGGVTRAAFAPDGERVLTASEDDTVRVWTRTADGHWSAQVLEAHEDLVIYAAFAPDGQRIVTASYDATARVWTPMDVGGWRSQVLAGHDGDVYHAAFAPVGAQIVTAASDGTARIWSATGDGVLSAQVLAGHVGPVNRASFGPGGDRLVTASADGTVRVWDVQWLTTRPLDRSFPTDICREKLPPSLRLITEQDTASVPSLRGREGEDVCKRFLRD